MGCNKMIVVSRQQSKYFKEHNPYYDTRAKHGREADTIILIVLKTPTGRWSKRIAVIRWNSERNVSDEQKRMSLAEYKTHLMQKTFKKEFNMGYVFGETILYSGTFSGVTNG
jgi:hypothetical protein